MMLRTLPAACRHLSLLLVCGLLLSACASRRPDQVDDLLARALGAAERYHQFDLDPEAVVLVDAIRAIDGSFPGLRELREDLDPDAREGVERTLLGVNRKVRPQLDRSPRARALLWLPDRLLDLLDVVTVGVHLGPGAFADAHVTRAGQVSAGIRSTGGLGLHELRSLGMKSQAEAGLTLVALGTQTYTGGLVGTSGTRGTANTSVGLHRPTAPLYQDLRDYWAIGASATLGFLGAEIDFHPLQFADFFAGLVGIDFLNDDFSHTRGLRLDAVERELLAELREVERAKDVVAAYLEAKRLGLGRNGDQEDADRGASADPAAAAGEGEVRTHPAAPADPSP